MGKFNGYEWMDEDEVVARLISLATPVAVSIVAVYLFASFIHWDIDAGNWSAADRFLSVFIGGVIGGWISFLANEVGCGK